MGLYNPMEDKQLNFYQPLLSVRRGSSSSSSTSSFAEAEKKQSSNPPPSIPPLPYYKSELKSGPVTNPGVVPFNWERIPGKPKNDTKLHNKVVDHPPPPPKYPPGRVFKLEDKEENGSSQSEGESYFDAVDMLSCSESSFLNCSLSGVSGFSGAESSGTFLDRDFMMGRFLPAAKAVTFETPPLGSRKQTASTKCELPKDVKKNSQYCYTPTSLTQHQEYGDEGEEEEDDNYPETETVSTKLCGGLIPWFCMLNVIPGMRGEAHEELPSVHKVPKKYSEPDPGIYKYNKTEKLSTAIRDAVYERRRLAVYQKSDTRLEFGHMKDELKKNIDSSAIKEDGDANSTSLESSANTASFHELSNKEAQKENGITLSDHHANDNKTIVVVNPILPPPLPKSPTESWLSRALPSISNKHPHSKTHLGSKNLGMTPPAKPKWEDVVKCSNLHSKNYGLALTPISEN